MSELPYVYIPPDGPMTPLVVSVPHAGTRIPAEDSALVASDTKIMLKDADLYVDRIYANAPVLGAGMITSRISRYVLDLNRSPDNVDRHVCDDVQTEVKENPRALIWRLSTNGDQLMTRKLSRAELDDRIGRVHTPYHEKLTAMLQARKERFGYAILLDGHSMPSVGRATHSDTGKRRADVVPGNNHGQSCAKKVTDLVVSHFEGSGFSVALNKPYSGGWITRNYGRPAQGIHAIQVELNRAIYMHEETCFWDGGIAQNVVNSAESLVSKLAALDLS